MVSLTEIVCDTVTKQSVPLAPSLITTSSTVDRFWASAPIGIGAWNVIRLPAHMVRAPIGREVDFSVRADLMHTGEHPDMANTVTGSYVATEFLGTLETDVFEIAPGHYVSVEQHRKIEKRERRLGEREIISWPAEAGTLLEEVG